MKLNRRPAPKINRRTEIPAPPARKAWDGIHGSLSLPNVGEHSWHKWTNGGKHTKVPIRAGWKCCMGQELRHGDDWYLISSGAYQFDEKAICCSFDWCGKKALCKERYTKRGLYDTY